MENKTPIELGPGAEGGGQGLPRSGEREPRQVSSLSAARPCHHVGSIESAARGPHGLLEDPNGVILVNHMREAIGVCSVSLFAQHQDEDLGSWSEWHFDSVNITHAKEMLYLHGASPQQIFAPFVLLRARPRPAPCPIPGFDDVIVAGVSEEVLASTSLEELFTTLSSRVEA
jgi:hypothetical protein